MRVRTFMKQFAPKVEDGTKRQTIRPEPKRPQDRPKVGDRESWREWRGLPYRSKQRELAQVELTSVERITIKRRVFSTGARISIRIKNRALKHSQWHDFAVADGFVDSRAMVEWFVKRHKFPFTGNLIKSKDI